MTEGIGEGLQIRVPSYWDDILATNFTKSHRAIFRAQKENWMRKAFSSDPIDKAKAIAAINALYELNGHLPPHIVWTQSPLENIFAKILCDEMLSLNSQSRSWDHSSAYQDPVWENIDSNIFDSRANEMKILNRVHKFGLDAIVASGDVWAAFGRSDDTALSAIRESINRSLKDKILCEVCSKTKKKGDRSNCEAAWSNICKTVQQSLGLSPANISDKIYAQELKDKFADCFEPNRSMNWWNYPDPQDGDSCNYVQGKLWHTLIECTYGQFNLAKVSEYMALFESGLIPENEALSHLHRLCESTGWVMPQPTVCYISARPTVLKLDDKGLPHCEDGPAIQYADGFSVYAWHGVNHPESWATQKLEASEALHWPNLAQRRVACEMLGWDTIIDELCGDIIDRDNDPEIGELIVAYFPDTGPEKFLRVLCGTGRKFALPVPFEMETARQANAWTWALEPNEYKPEIRT